jgi:hypothetical protein
MDSSWHWFYSPSIKVAINFIYIRLKLLVKNETNTCKYKLDFLNIIMENYFVKYYNDPPPPTPLWNLHITDNITID